jgi:hypothetical protein
MPQRGQAPPELRRFDNPMTMRKDRRPGNAVSKVSKSPARTLFPAYADQNLGARQRGRAYGLMDQSSGLSLLCRV